MSVRVHSFSAARSYRIGQIQSEKLRWARGDLKFKCRAGSMDSFHLPTLSCRQPFSHPHGAGGEAGSWGLYGGDHEGPCQELAQAKMPRSAPSPLLSATHGEVAAVLTGMQPSPVSHPRTCVRPGGRDWATHVK